MMKTNRGYRRGARGVFGTLVAVRIGQHLTNHNSGRIIHAIAELNPTLALWIPFILTFFHGPFIFVCPYSIYRIDFFPYSWASSCDFWWCRGDGYSMKFLWGTRQLFLKRKSKWMNLLSRPMGLCIGCMSHSANSEPPEVLFRSIQLAKGRIQPYAAMRRRASDNLEITTRPLGNTAESTGSGRTWIDCPWMSTMSPISYLGHIFCFRVLTSALFRFTIFSIMIYAIS